MNSKDVIGRLDAEIGSSLDGGAMAVGLVCLDRVAELREVIGYESCELVLAEFANRIGSFVRRQDTLLPIEPTRLALVLRGLSSAEHLELAGAKLDRLFAAPMEMLGESVRLAVHAGFVMPVAGSVQEILRHAESALRKARESRQPWALWDGTTVPGVGIEFVVERRIEEAIAEGEFVLYHQPKIDARHATIIGAEALMRWHDPRRGVVAPSDFIAIAERAGSIRPLTSFAIKAALAECRHWPSDIGVAVNVAPTLIDDDEIVRVVRDALALFDVAPARLTLEITESSLARNRDRAFAVLSQVRESGVRVSIDDFGTGYSSLSHFRDIPADELKIDRSFVAKMMASDADARIVKTIIDLGHNFAMKVVAEGVEDAETAARLKGLGCDQLQGYWIAKPLPAPEFRAWLARRLGQPHADAKSAPRPRSSGTRRYVASTTKPSRPISDPPTFGSSLKRSP